MGCTKCKKKQVAEAPVSSENARVAEVVSAYRLRDGISWEQLGLEGATERQIKKFLDANPNRKSLFAVIPNNESDEKDND